MTRLRQMKGHQREGWMDGNSKFEDQLRSYRVPACICLSDELLLLFALPALPIFHYEHSIDVHDSHEMLWVEMLWGCWNSLQSIEMTWNDMKFNSIDVPWSPWPALCSDVLFSLGCDWRTYGAAISGCEKATYRRGECSNNAKVQFCFIPLSTSFYLSRLSTK